jgi:hypothetical protein
VALIVLGLDPGTTESGWVLWEQVTGFPGEVLEKGKGVNEAALLFAKEGGDLVVIEQFKCYGNAVGDETLAAVRWSGRFEQAAIESGAQVLFLPRKTVVTHLCGNPRAKDGNVRQALIDRLGPPGTKKKPGPTYGIANDMWSALALCIVGLDLKEGRA